MQIHKDTTFATHGWELESAVERNREHPETFPIPSDRERQSLEFGDRVKLLFLFQIFDESYPEGIVSCERMWATVIDSSDGELIGLLESAPRSSDVLRPDDAFWLHPSHVCDIMPKPSPEEFSDFRNALHSYVAKLNLL